MASVFWLQRDRDGGQARAGLSESRWQAGAGHGVGDRAPSAPGVPSVLRDDPGPPVVPTALQVLVAQNEQLRREVERLRSLPARSESARDDRTHGFTREDLVAMAGRCEIRYDYPFTAHDDRPVRIPDDKAQELEFSATQVRSANDVLSEQHRRFRDEVKAIYVAATGDEDGAETMATDAMIIEVQNKALPEDASLARQRLARERAGLLAPPADLAGVPAVEQLLRLLVDYGDRVERAMAERIEAGPARKYRELRWNQSSSNSSGCPE